MDSGTTPLKNPAELARDLYEILLPFGSDVRQKAVAAAMTLLGESPAPLSVGSSSLSGSAGVDFGDLKLGPKALKWIHKNAIGRAALDEVFHLTDGGAEVSATSVRGGGRREMTINCYLLSGVRALLQDDAASFDDSDAIALCKRLTAYDKNNHTAYRQAVGNRMTGAKPTFTLTGPGETAAAELVKQMGNSK